MRIVIALPLLLLAACQVTEDDANDSMTIQYNQDLAENVAADVAVGAQQAGEAIANAGEDVANGAEAAVDRAENVDVDVDTNTADNRN